MWIVSPPPGNNHLATPWAMQTNMTKTKPFVFSKVDLLPGPHFGLWPYHLLKLKSQALAGIFPFHQLPQQMISQDLLILPPKPQINSLALFPATKFPQFVICSLISCPNSYNKHQHESLPVTVQLWTDLFKQSTYFTEQSRIFHSLCMDWKCGWRLKACSLWSSSASTLVDSCEASVREMDITWKGWWECHA